MAEDPALPAGVRLSLAAAQALRLAGGRTYRNARTRCVNLLLDRGCMASCGYCGLARKREPVRTDTFIRVDWPVVDTSKVLDRIGRPDLGIGRVCVSMVAHKAAFGETLALVRALRSAPPPVAVLATPQHLDEVRLRSLRDAGADRIGIGLDTAVPSLFARYREVPSQGILRWDDYREAIREARMIFGPWQVNIHLVVGLGETDRDLLELMAEAHGEEIDAYLFSFYPEPGTALEDHERPSLQRYRRLQLGKALIEGDLGRLAFSPGGSLDVDALDADAVEGVLEAGTAFRTHGCPGLDGTWCNRPFGSYRPGEAFRDYPFAPETDDLTEIRNELGLASRHGAA